MGYTTSFDGAFYVDGPLSAAALELIHGLSTTRRMKRDSQKLADRLGITLDECIAKYGREGQLYCGEKEQFGQVRTSDVMDFNSPPVGQPGLWCQWIYDEDARAIVWNKVEKFYFYVEWIEYLIRMVIAPEGRALNGIVHYFGQNKLDMGFIEIENNVVTQYAAASFQLV